MDLKTALELVALSAILLFAFVNYAVRLQEMKGPPEKSYVPVWMQKTIALTGIMGIGILVWMALSSVYFFFGMAGPLAVTAIVLAFVLRYLWKTREIKVFLWLHKERRFPSILQTAIVLIIAMVVLFFVWPSAFWLVASVLGAILPVISLILVIRVWAMRGDI